MSTLAAENPRVFETGHDEFLNELPMIDNDIIYDGAAVGELNDTGTYQPLGTGSTVDKFAGFACDNPGGKVDNTVTGHAAGFRNVKVKQKGRVILSVTGVTAITDVEKIVWATDDDTFTLTYAAGAVEIGRITRWISGTKCVVTFKAFNLRESFEFSYDSETVDLATDRAILLASRPLYVESIDEIHSVAAGGASVIQVTKDVTTDAPGAGTDMLSNNTNTGFDLNATANTVQNGTLKTTAGLRKLNAGDRLSIDYAQAIQSTAGVKIVIRLRPL